MQMLTDGQWQPTAKPSIDGYYSYHISALYSPPGMFDWTHYAHQFNECFGKDGLVRRSKLHSFNNLVLGLTFEDEKKETKSDQLLFNIRDYKEKACEFH
jgi:hypothetical protein